MTLTQLSYFCTIVEVGNMSRAAKQLFVTPSTLSISMANLEKELGVQLFTRSVNRADLTECGMYYYRCIRKVLDELSDAAEEVRGTDTPVFGGGVRIDLPFRANVRHIIPFKRDLSLLISGVS